MRSSIILIIFFFIVSCSDNKHVSIVSFRAGPDTINSNKEIWTKNFPLIESFLKTESFDIIGTQGVTYKQASDLKNILTDYAYVGIRNDNTKEFGEYCPIFYNKEKFALLTKSQFALTESSYTSESDTFNEPVIKTVTWIKLKSNRTGHIFYVFNTSFCLMDELERERSAIITLKKINEISGDAPVILIGDFCVGKQSRVYNTLTLNWNRFYSLIDAENVAKKVFCNNIAVSNSVKDSLLTNINSFIFVNSCFSISKYKIYGNNKEDVCISGSYPVSVSFSFLFEPQPRPGKSFDVPW